MDKFLIQEQNIEHCKTKIIERNKSVDITRALTIILVVIGHYVPENSPQWYIVINQLIYSFHMPLFLFISGYIYKLTFRNKSYGKFVKRKIKRLMLPYITTSLLIITIKLLTPSKLLDNPINIYSYIEMFYFPIAGYFLWFVITLFLIFLIIPFFKTYNKVCMLLLFSIFLYYIPIQFPEYFCLDKFKESLLYFMFGVFIAYNHRLKQIAKQIPLILYIFLFTILFVLKETIKNDLLAISIALVGIIIMAKISIFLSEKQYKFKETLLRLSSASFIIYLFHTTFEGLPKAILSKYIVFSYSNFVFILNILIVTIIGIWGPFITYKYLRSNRLLSFLFGLR